MSLAPYTYSWCEYTKVRGQHVPKITYDAPLFETLDPDVGSAMCQKAYDDATVVRQVNERLNSVPMPGDWYSAASLVQSMVGIGAAGPITSHG